MQALKARVNAGELRLQCWRWSYLKPGALPQAGGDAAPLALNRSTAEKFSCQALALLRKSPAVKVPPVLPGLVCATSLLLVFPLEQARAQPRPLRDSHAYSRPATSLSPEFDPDLPRDSRFRNLFPHAPILEGYDDEFGALPLPSPTPLPSASPLPSPPVFPTPTILPTTTPAPSSLPTFTPSPLGSPPPPPSLPSPPPPPPIPPVPNPTAGVLPPVVPEIAHPSGASGPPQWQRCQVEVWTNDSTTPQRPTRQGHRFELAYVTATEPALVRLQFPPAAAGNSVIVKPGPGVTVDPAQRELPIGASGECLLSVSLTGNFRESDITIYYVGTRITLPLARALSAPVATTKSATKSGR